VGLVLSEDWKGLVRSKHKNNWYTADWYGGWTDTVGEPVHRRPLKDRYGG
jgi:hypothetical protein